MLRTIKEKFSTLKQSDFKPLNKQAYKHLKTDKSSSPFKKASEETPQKFKQIL